MSQSAQLEVVWCESPSPMGSLLLAARNEGLLGVWFAGQRHFAGPAQHWQRVARHPLLDEAAGQLAQWFAGQRRSFELPLAPEGSAFQQTVWQQLARIGFGEQCSYGELAQVLGKPGAARAVGAATGRNPLSIIIPCHRLLAGDGALTGYAGGLSRKRWLLAFEQGKSLPSDAAWFGAASV